MSPDLNFSGTPRSALFDGAVDALQKELERRLALLNTRKDDCQRLQELAEFLSAREAGRQAPPLQRCRTAIGCRCNCWSRSSTTSPLGDLMCILAVQGIESARNESWDVGMEAGYELTLNHELKIAARIRHVRSPAKAVPA